jgi:hypothetical protein
MLGITRRRAARWLLRYLEEHPAAGIEEAALAASSLVRADRPELRGSDADASGHGRKSD